MLAQKIFAVVVAVGSPHHSMDVIPRWLAGLIFHQRAYRVLVIKFDQDHRAVDPVIKYRINIDAADPGKISFIQMPGNVIHVNLGLGVG